MTSELKALVNKLTAIKFQIIELEIREWKSDVQQIELNELRNEYDRVRVQLSNAKAGA